MKLWVSRLARLSILLVCVLALYRLFPVVADQLRGLDACPMLGPVPACYPVFFGYIAIALSVALDPLRSGWIFLSGWLPVCLFALSGTSLELLGRPTCPRSASNVPLCFFSLAIASALLAVFILARRIPSVGRH
ncbi:MAG: hypothetical protein ACC641_11690 [Acidiferrobacterales bacterium]